MKSAAMILLILTMNWMWHLSCNFFWIFSGLYVWKWWTILSIFYSCPFLSGIGNVITCFLPSPVLHYVLTCICLKYWWFHVQKLCAFHDWICLITATTGIILDLEGFSCNFYFSKLWGSCSKVRSVQDISYTSFRDYLHSANIEMV